MIFYTALSWHELFHHTLTIKGKTNNKTGDRRQFCLLIEKIFTYTFPRLPDPQFSGRKYVMLSWSSASQRWSFTAAFSKPSSTDFNQVKIFISWGTGLTCIGQTTVHNKSPRAETLWNPSMHAQEVKFLCLSNLQQISTDFSMAGTFLVSDRRVIHQHHRSDTDLLQLRFCP